MKGFKLLAIRPLEGCSERFTKILTKGEFYTFYNEYQFSLNDKGKVEIEFKNKSPQGLVKVNGVNHDIDVNISAIVGKNGTGKSTIFELYYLAMYYLAIKRDKPLLEPNLQSIKKEIQDLENEPSSNDTTARISYLKSERQKIEEILKTFKVQLFFSVDENIFEFNTDSGGKNIEDRGSLKLLEGNKRVSRQIKLSKLLDEEVFNPLDFAYTCVVNYSVYGLNALEIGSWINTLFHKNDAYRTPIVINPMRVNGDFEMDQENSLIRNRILMSLGISRKHEEVDDFLGVKRKNLKGVRFKLKPNPNIAGLKNLFDGSKEIIYSYTSLYTDGEKPFEQFVDELSKQLEVEIRSQISSNHLLKYCLEYAFSKFNRIHDKYPKFRRAKLSPYLKVLLSDDSHITLKFRQSINFIINDRFEKIKKNFFKDEPQQIDVLNIDKKDLDLRVNYSKKEFKKEFDDLKVEEILANLPPSIFDIELNFGGELKNDLSFLSSGEKHIVHSLQSVYYHLRNIDSINEEELGYHYNHVNILLDEIELYQHPEMQKEYISTILKGIEEQNLSRIKSINILFSTHSPFILSDIYDTNILFLETSEGNGGKSIPKKVDIPRTLGSNIHELLAHSFFLSDGYMGNWVKKYILSLRSYLTNKKETDEIQWNEEKSQKFIKLIGEPIIRERLQHLFDDKFLNSKEKIDAKIEQLIKRKEKLQ